MNCIMKHTLGPWTIWERGNDIDPSCKIFAGNAGIAQTLGGNDEANALFITTAPDMEDMLYALTHGWEVTCISMYDEEGVEGWRWTDPHNNEYEELGNWDEIPPWPELARTALISERGENNEKH